MEELFERHLDDLRQLSPYKILGVEEGATDAEVKSAFRRMAIRCHSDRCKDPNADDYFRLVIEAHEAITANRQRVSEVTQPQDGKNPQETPDNLRNLFGDLIRKIDGTLLELDVMRLKRDTGK